MVRRRSLRLAAVGLAASMLVAACGDSDDDPSTSSPDVESAATTDTSTTDAAATEAGPREVTDMAGDTVEVPVPAESIIATDNRIFRTLDAWGVELAAAPLPLMNEDTVSYPSKADDIIDLGNHREPNLEGVVAAEPDLVLNGQRFSDYKDDIAGLISGDAALVDTNVVETEPLGDQLKRLTTLLGEIFDRQDDAEALTAAFDAAVQRASEAYDPEQTVVGVIVSGGNIAYAAPSTGRAVGPVFDMLGLTPALGREGSTNHQGDDISVEAIAEANPDWILILDRDAAVAAEEEGYSPADEVIAGSEALQNVSAVQSGNIVYMPADFYVHEDIQNYTTFLESLADAFETAAS